MSMRWERGILSLVLTCCACSGSGLKAMDGSADGPEIDSGPTDTQGEGQQPDASGDAAVVLPAARPVGINLPFLFLMYIGESTGGQAEAQREMMLAAQNGVTHVRFIASAFWPATMKTKNGWIADREVYLGLFDLLVKDARRYGLHLVPSLLWNNLLFPDLAGEPGGQLFVPGSASRTLAESYVTSVVSRHKDDETILFWEIGNELNLGADIDVSCDTCQGNTACLVPTVSDLGTPCRRTSQDNYFSCNACRGVSSPQEDLVSFVSDMAALIRGIDPSHSVSSGFAMPRPSAYHLAHQPCPACDWTLDTPDQYEEELLRLHPPGVDVMSIHAYPGADLARFGDSDLAGAGLLARTQTIAVAAGKQLYVGEYGEQGGGTVSCAGGASVTCAGDPNRIGTRRILDTIVAAGIPWSALWAFEGYGDTCTCYTVVASDPFMDVVRAHQQAAGSCEGRADGTACPVGTCTAGQ